MKKKKRFLVPLLSLMLLLSVTTGVLLTAYAHAGESTRAEAEAATVSYGKITEDISASGGLTVSGLTQDGAAITYKLNADSAGEKDVTVAYKTTQDATATLSVNGEESSLALSAENTEVALKATLAEGDNTLTIKNVSSGNVAFDYITIASEDVTVVKGEPVVSEDGTNQVYYAKDAMLHMATVAKGTFDGEEVEYVTDLTYNAVHSSCGYPILAHTGDPVWVDRAQVRFNVSVDKTDYYRIRLYYSTAAADYGIVHFVSGNFFQDAGLGTVKGEGVFSEDVFVDVFANLYEGENLLRFSLVDLTRTAQIYAIEVRKANVNGHEPCDVEAENAILDNAQINKIAGSRFEYNVEAQSSDGSVTFNVKAPAAGKYTVGVIGIKADVGQTVNVSVNGKQAATYAGTGEVAYPALRLPFVAGNNTLTFSGAIFELDALELHEGLYDGNLVLDTEKAVLTGGVPTAQNVVVFSNRMWTNFENNGTATWTVNAEEEGDYGISLRSFQGAVSDVQILVNGETAATLTPEAPGAWINTNGTIRLSKGENTVTLSCAATCVDCMIIRSTAVTDMQAVTKIQAEDGYVSKGIVQKDDSIGGYHVSVCSMSEILWDIEAPETGTYRAAIRFFSRNNAASVSFTAGGTSGETFTLPQFGFWSTKYVTLDLKKGANSVLLNIFSSQDNHDVVIDWLEIYGGVTLSDREHPYRNENDTGTVYESEEGTLNLAVPASSVKGYASKGFYACIGTMPWNYFAIGRNPLVASSVMMDNIYVEESGTYTLRAYYDGMIQSSVIPEEGSSTSAFIYVNGGNPELILSKVANGLEEFRPDVYFETDVYLVKGYNHVRFGAFTAGVNIDRIEIFDRAPVKTSDFILNLGTDNDGTIELTKDSSVLVDLFNSAEKACDVEFTGEGDFVLYVDGEDTDSFTLDGTYTSEKVRLPQGDVRLELVADSDTATLTGLTVYRADIVLRNVMTASEGVYGLEAEYGTLTMAAVIKGETSNGLSVVLDENGSAVYKLPAFPFNTAKATVYYENTDAEKLVVTVGTDEHEFELAGEETSVSFFFTGNRATTITVTAEGGSVEIDKLEFASATDAVFTPAEMLLHNVRVSEDEDENVTYVTASGSYMSFNVILSMALTTDVTVSATGSEGNITVTVGENTYTAALDGSGVTTFENVEFLSGRNAVKISFDSEVSVSAVTITKCGGTKDKFAFKQNEKGSGFIVCATEGLLSEAKVDGDKVTLSKADAWAQFNVRVLFGHESEFGDDYITDYNIRLTFADNLSATLKVLVNGSEHTAIVENGVAVFAAELVGGSGLRAGNNSVIVYGADGKDVTLISVEALYSDADEKFVRYEAELGETNLCNVQGHYGVQYGHYSYTGFVADMDLPDSSVTIRVYAESDGVYVMRVAYSTTATDRPTLKLYNHSYKGTEKEYTVTFNAPSKGWGLFRTMNTTVELKAGWNELQFTKGNSSVQLDYIEIGERKSDFPTDDGNVSGGDDDNSQYGEAKKEGGCGCGGTLTGSACGMAAIVAVLAVAVTLIGKKKRT